jgi:hypothetical protein
MKKAFILGLAICLSCGVLFSAGCAKKVGSVSEAIQNSQAFKTVQEKANYLIGQAQAFYNSKQYQDAVNAAQYVLNKLDSNSQQAKDLIEKAKAQLQTVAQKAMGGMSNKLFGK